MKDIVGQVMTFNGVWGLDNSKVSTVIFLWLYCSYAGEHLSKKYVIKYLGVIEHHVSNLLLNSSEKKVLCTELQLFCMVEIVSKLKKIKCNQQN